MACQIADNEPLTTLRYDLGLGKQCHSLRDDCIHHLIKPSGNFSMAAPGAVIGYCQALFRKQANPELHTNFVTEQLSLIDAPWKLSHELFWLHREIDSPIDFFDKGFKPLLGSGRVPVVISSLDPAIDDEEIRDILSTTPAIFPGESILLRVALNNILSIEKTANILNNILQNAFTLKEMPKWWLLLQGNLSYADWHKLMVLMGNNWKYINIAVNPFTASSLPNFCWSQVTVAQIVVGHASGITQNGNIKLAKGMSIQGAEVEGEYNFHKYIDLLSNLNIVPTLIILGPALSEWTDEENRERVAMLLPHLKKACDKMWDFINDERKENVWALKA